MRPIHVSVIAGLSLATLGVSQAEVEGEVHVGLSNEYVWRGIDQGAGSMAEAGLALSTEVAGYTLGANVWYASTHGSNSFDEVDYTVSIGKAYGCVDVEIGYIYYDFPSTAGASNLGELYTTVGTEFVGTDVAFTYFWDIEGDNDGYSELTIDKSFELSSTLALNVGATISYDWETTDVHHYGLSASLDYAFNEVLTVSPYVSATFAEDGAQMGALSITGAEDDEIFGGVIVTAAF
jgi:uncharacterized protein (TIGR02001 family)